MKRLEGKEVIFSKTHFITFQSSNILILINLLIDIPSFEKEHCGQFSSQALLNDKRRKTSRFYKNNAFLLFMKLVLQMETGHRTQILT